MQKKVKYSEAIETRFTEAVSYAIAKDENGIANPITLGWIIAQAISHTCWQLLWVFKVIRMKQSGVVSASPLYFQMKHRSKRPCFSVLTVEKIWTSLRSLVRRLPRLQRLIL